ncbi:MAG: hypothetical protein WC326_05710 [Candidatus Delongbacteria bacterium]
MTTDPSFRADPPDPFEELLRRQLGPRSLEAPPLALRAQILQQVAGLPASAQRFRLRWVHVANALALSFLGLLACWLLLELKGANLWLVRLGRELPDLGPGPEWRSSLDLLFSGGLLELARNPLLLAVLPVLLLPLFYYMQDER